MKQIYKIFDQGNKPACQSYAIATLVSHLLKKLVDAEKLFAECDRAGGGTNLKSALRWCKEQGVPMMDGTRQMIDYMFFVPNNTGFKAAIDEHGGAVVGYCLHDRDRLENRIVDGRLSRRPLDVHAMAVYDYDSRDFMFANSWGDKWNGDGTLKVQYVLMSQDYVKEAYYLTIKND